MTGFGVLIGLWIVAIAIDRFTDKVCAMLANITVKIGDITIKHAKEGGE